jgi:hypothetical protein
MKPWTPDTTLTTVIILENGVIERKSHMSVADTRHIQSQVSVLPMLSMVESQKTAIWRRHIRHKTAWCRHSLQIGHGGSRKNPPPQPDMAYI